MFDFIRNHIVIKTLLAIAACIAIVCTVSGYFFYASYKNKMFSDYYVEVQNIRQIIEGSYAIHMWNIQPESIRSLNETVLSAGQYLAITIFDKGIDDLYDVNISTRKIVNGEMIFFEHSSIPYAFDNNYIDVSTGSIEYQGIVVGKYELFHTNEHIYEHLYRIIYNIIVVFIAVTIVVTIILLILLNKFVIKKVFSLVDFAKSMANEKKYHKRVVIQGSDEVSVLAKSINEMLEQIELKDSQKDQAGRKLSQSESYLKNIFDASPDAIFICEANQGVIIDVNNSASAIFQYDRDELIGKDLGMVSSGEQKYDQRNAFAWLTQARDIGPQRFEWLSKKSDGSFFWTEIDARFAQIGGKDCFIVLARDVTQRKRIEETIHERERQLRTLSDSLPGGFVYQVIIEKAQRRFTYVSAGVEDLHGVSADEVMKDASALYNTIHEQDRQALAEEEASALQQMSRFHMEVRYISPSGGIQWLMLNSAPRSLSGGAVIWDGVAIDITARKVAETEREKLQAQLLQAQKMEAVGTLAGGVAHDFNNLLQAMSGNIQMLQISKSGDHPDASRLKTVENSIERAAELVRQLLIFSRKAEVKREVVDMNYLVRETANVLERTIPKMIDLELRLAEGLWSVEASPVQVEQVLLNLGNNAAQAMPEGGRLTMETKNMMLDKGAAKTILNAHAGPHVLLCVTDTGCGMDKETLRHIFDPFFTTKTVGEGTGLGLTTVYGIVTGHGGSVQCYSEPGLGTTFRLYWPANPELAETPKEASKHEDQKPLGGTETILVVDDEEDIRQVTTEALESFGYFVLEAASGEDALAVYAEKGNNVDLIIMDLGMPGMGGRQCLLELVRLDPGVRVLIASGYATGKLAEEVEQDGTLGFIGKPYQLAELLTKVRQILEGVEHETGELPG